MVVSICQINAIGAIYCPMQEIGKLALIISVIFIIFAS